ncbi:RNA methyltransferase [bacterium]|nr:RNA methyltransferase [bacterium]
MRIQEVQTLDIPELKPYLTLRRPQEHIQQGIFVAEGEKVVRRLLQSGLTVVSLLLTRKWLEELNTENSLAGIDIFIADKSLLESIVGYSLHQGIMAVSHVPNEPDLHELVANVPHPFLFVALDGIVSAENVGVIVRNAGAFGAHAILADKTSSSPYLRRAVRNSMGAVFRLPVLHVNLAETLPKLACNVIAATPNADRTLQEADLAGDLCVVLGNEGSGISPEVLGKCDFQIAIPMLNDNDSLNVASASAVFLYEICVSRKLRPQN